MFGIVSTLLARVVVIMIVQEKVATKVDAQEPEAEFAELFQPYAEELGITEEDIDDEVSEAQVALDKLREKGRDKTPPPGGDGVKIGQVKKTQSYIEKVHEVKVEPAVFF